MRDNSHDFFSTVSDRSLRDLAMAGSVRPFFNLIIGAIFQFRSLRGINRWFWRRNSVKNLETDTDYVLRSDKDELARDKLWSEPRASQPRLFSKSYSRTRHLPYLKASGPCTQAAVSCPLWGRNWNQFLVILKSWKTCLCERLLISNGRDIPRPCRRTKRDINAFQT